MNNKNYRVMKFFEPVDKKDKSRGYVRLDMRGNRGNLIVAAENLGDAKSTSEVYLYKDKQNKIKVGDINNKKGLIKKMLTFGNNSAIEDYNVCAVVKDGKIVLYSNLFNTSSMDVVRKLEEEQVAPETDEVMESKEIKEPKEPKEPMMTKEIKGIKEMQPKEEKEITKVITENTLSDKAKEEAVKETVKEPVRTIKIPIKEEIKAEVKKEVKEVKEEVNEKDKTAASQQRFRNRFDENIYNTLKEYKTLEPLSVKLKNFSWWYIPYDEMGVKNGILPFYSQIISSYYPYPMSARVTTCANLMKKYGHYIFGIYKENDEIVKFIYGVPGEFTKEEQPYKGVTGFKNWSYATKDNKKDSGYWLAFVNPKTGETTDPPQVSLT
jgi:hypothetical protein